jgi:DNA-binding winged helix-turn-helix (wHTH) protein
MRQPRYVVFDRFRLDRLDERLWDGEKYARLGQKALAVLQALVTRPGQLVTKDDLLASAWPDTAVSEAVLTTAIRELRQALRDAARTPRLIETVHGRGYRFIAAVTETDIPARSAVARATSSPRPLVGREQELARLHQWNASVQHGTRRIVFVAGEAGIGKTALAGAFVSETAARGNLLVGHGQCIEHYGAGEAYLPILEALGRVGREHAGLLVDVLRQYAPTWLAHLPSLASEAEMQPATPVTPARMLRELADALEILTARDPLVLVLEDLHWSDSATLEWLAYAARRADRARLLVLGTYRPVEAVLHNTALRRLTAELRQHPQCAELVLDYLSRDAVEAYVRERCGSIPGLRELADVLHRRTGGHPLFLTTIVDELMRNGLEVSADAIAVANVTPASVRQFIEHRFEQLSRADKAILEGASVAGDPFSVAVVAAATSVPEAAIEARCAAWAREGQFLVADGNVTWPDGVLSPRYRFRHALYPEAVYAAISPERRAHLHLQIGERLEAAYGKRAAPVAAELAMHFEQGRDARRAVPYLEQAARNALQRSAYSEAHRHLERGQTLLEALPEGRQRRRRELQLLLLLGRVLAATKGWAVEEVENVFLRARDLAEDLHDTPGLLQALWGLIGATFVGAEFRKAQAIGQRVLELANKQRDPVFTILGHMEVGGTQFHLGETTADTERHFADAETLYDPRQHRAHIAYFGVDMGLFSRSWATHFRWHAGYPDRARRNSEETLALARELSHPLSLGVALAYAAMLHQFCRDVRRVNSIAEITITQCSEHGFPYYLAWAEVLRGWSHAAAGASDAGIAEIRRGIEILQAKAGARLSYYRALLAEACAWRGRNDEALEALAYGFEDIGKSEECWWEPELHRLRGELLRGADAEACFHRAIEVARRQRARSLELRAALSLGRFWREAGKNAEARRLVSDVYDWFGEGFDTRDLADASSFLTELASQRAAAVSRSSSAKAAAGVKNHRR